MEFCSSINGGSNALLEHDKFCPRVRAFMKKFFQRRFRHLRKVEAEVQPGDILEFKRGPYFHFALYRGGGLVMHVDNGPGNKVNGKIRRQTLKEVCGSSKLRIRNMEKQAFAKYKKRTLPIRQIIANAERDEQQGQVPYELMGRNCEYYVTSWRYGTGFSRQAENPVVYTTGGRTFLATVGIFGAGFFAGAGLYMLTNTHD